MKRFLMLIGLVLFVPLTIYAGQIYGNLRDPSGQPIQEKITVEIKCGVKVFTGQTDAYGSYRVYAAEKGRCTFKVVYQGQDASFDVYSYDDPVRYDFDLVSEKGRYTLRRR